MQFWNEALDIQALFLYIF